MPAFKYLYVYHTLIACPPMMWLAMVVPMQTANWKGVTAHHPDLPAHSQRRRLSMLHRNQAQEPLLQR